MSRTIDFSKYKFKNASQKEAFNNWINENGMDFFTRPSKKDEILDPNMLSAEKKKILDELVEEKANEYKSNNPGFIENAIGATKDFGKELINSGIINPLNLPLELTGKQIPQLKTSGKHTIAEMAGDIGGFAVPFMGELKAANKLAEILPLLRKAELLPNYLKAALTAGTAGALSSPTGSREEGGLLASLSGAGAESIASALRGLGAHEQAKAAINELSFSKQAAQKAFDMAKNNYLAKAKDFSKRFDSLENEILNFKNKSTPGYNVSAKNLLKEYLNRAKGLSDKDENVEKFLDNPNDFFNKLQSGDRNVYEAPINLIKNKIQDDNENMVDLYRHYRSLNKDLGVLKDSRGNDRPISEFRAIKKLIPLARNEIANKLPLTTSEDFLELDKDYSNFKKLYGTSPKGAKSKFLKLLNFDSSGDYYQPSDLIKEHIPKSPNEGIGGITKLINMVGDAQTAKDAINSELFSNLSSGNPLLSNFQRVFNRLSPEQRDYLFNGLSPHLNKAAGILNKGKSYNNPFILSALKGLPGAAVGGAYGYKKGGISEGVLDAVIGDALMGGASKGVRKFQTNYPWVRKNILENGISKTPAIVSSGLINNLFRENPNND